MNETDIRVAYLQDTGDLPLWAKDRRGKVIKKYRGGGKRVKTWQSGYPRSDYGRWMENLLGGSKKMRDKYLFETGCFGSYSFRNLEVLSVNYSYWLEEQIINNPRVLKNVRSLIK